MISEENLHQILKQLSDFGITDDNLRGHLKYEDYKTDDNSILYRHRFLLRDVSEQPLHYEFTPCYEVNKESGDYEFLAIFLTRKNPHAFPIVEADKKRLVSFQGLLSQDPDFHQQNDKYKAERDAYRSKVNNELLDLQRTNPPLFRHIMTAYVKHRHVWLNESLANIYKELLPAYKVSCAVFHFLPSFRQCIQLLAGNYVYLSANNRWIGMNQDKDILNRFPVSITGSYNPLEILQRHFPDKFTPAMLRKYDEQFREGQDVPLTSVLSGRGLLSGRADARMNCVYLLQSEGQRLATLYRNKWVQHLKITKSFQKKKESMSDMDRGHRRAPKPRTIKEHLPHGRRRRK